VSEDLFDEDVAGPSPEGRGITIDDFVAYLPSHVYIFTPCREVWTGVSVNSRLGKIPVLTKAGTPKRNKDGDPISISATFWLDNHRGVTQMTWCPGFPMLIQDQMVVDGGWIERPDVMCFNHYRPPRLQLGDARKAELWLDHVRRIYPDDADHILKWLAQRVQCPQEKINHALVLGGPQGIGKDTLLEPLKYAVGPWNFHEVSPSHLLGRFNAFVKSVILRVNEARDLGEVDRFKFYDHAKIYTAAPPDVLRVDEKYLREHYVFNVLGFILTKNHKIDGIFLPADDRRHYVAWSDRTKEDFTQEYWPALWRYYADGGFSHVAAYLMEFDLSGFDPKMPPPRTAAFWDIVNTSRAPEDAELADVLDKLGKPDAVTLAELVAAANGGIAEWLLDRRNRRALPHRLERCEYVSVRNPYAKDGLWKLKGARQVIYAKVTLTPQDREAAAQRLYQAGQ
jgi:hypothetical protein